jgi:hypothetical protein
LPKKVAKKSKSAIDARVAGKKASKKFTAANDEPKIRTSKKLAKIAKTTDCRPYGRIGAPRQELNRLRDEVFQNGWKEDGCAAGDPYPGRPRRAIASLLDYSTLTKKDSECLSEALNKHELTPVKICFKSTNKHVFIWGYFSIAWNDTDGKIQISCTQFWPERECPPPKRSRKLDPYVGDIEISITWPDPDDPSTLDPSTEQVIVLNEVEISPDHDP